MWLLCSKMLVVVPSAEHFEISAQISVEPIRCDLSQLLSSCNSAFEQRKASRKKVLQPRSAVTLVQQSDTVPPRDIRHVDTQAVRKTELVLQDTQIIWTDAEQRTRALNIKQLHTHLTTQLLTTKKPRYFRGLVDVPLRIKLNPELVQPRLRTYAWSQRK